MLKRLAALLFVFVIAGQVLADVCACLGGDKMAQDSCCARTVLTANSIRAITCCDTDCMLQQSERLPQDRTQTIDKLQFQPAAEQALVEQRSFQPVAVPTAPTSLPQIDHRLKFARPPDLVVLNCDFLI